MSWASHNPEAYDEILKAGIVTKLCKELAGNGFDLENSELFAITALVESLAEAKDTRVYKALLDFAQHEIVDAEADHWATLGDSRG